MISLIFPAEIPAEKANKLLEIQQKIKKTLHNISRSKEEEEMLRSNTENLNQNLVKKDADLRNYDKRRTQVKSEISGLVNELETLTGELEDKKQYLKEYVNFLYKQQYGNDTFMLMSATDYQDLARKSKYISLVANYESRVMQKYTDQIREIHAKQEILEEMLENIDTEMEAARQSRKELKADLSKNNLLISLAKEKQAEYEKKAKDLETSSQRLQGMVSKLEKKAIPDSITGSGFASLKGHLPWPVQGRVLSSYGEYRDPAFNIPVFRNGIEIEAQEQEIPIATAGGRVIFADSYENYGMLLIIDHGNGYNTLYGNLSEISLQKGDLLIKGTDLGKITRSRSLNKPALYFEIRYNGKPVDPSEWLETHG